MNKEIMLIDVENKCPADVDEIVKHTIKFLDIMSLHQNIKYETDMLDIIKDFQLATLEFSNAKNLLVNLLMPEDNPYIKKAEESNHWLVDDIGRVDKRLSEFQGKVGSKIEGNVQLKKPNSFVELFSYYNFLIESMNGLVFYPLVNSTKKYLKIKDKFKADKENNLDLKQTREKEFLYWVFLEMYHSSLSLGGIAREEIQKRYPTKDGTSTSATNPPQFPQGTGIDNTSFSQVNEENSMENLFNNPFEDIE